VLDRGAHSRGWLLAGCRNLLPRKPLSQQPSARMFFVAMFVLTVLLGSDAFTREQDVSTRQQDMSSVGCRQPAPGSAVREPQDLRSRDGVLRVDLTIYDQKQPDGSTRYCYLTPDGVLSPTLRLKPGDLLILRFKNNLIDFSATARMPPDRLISSRSTSSGLISIRMIRNHGRSARRKSCRIRARAAP
jgi:hypothetical protein